MFDSGSGGGSNHRFPDHSFQSLKINFWSAALGGVGDFEPAKASKDQQVKYCRGNCWIFCLYRRYHLEPKWSKGTGQMQQKRGFLSLLLRFIMWCVSAAAISYFVKSVAEHFLGSNYRYSHSIIYYVIDFSAFFLVAFLFWIMVASSSSHRDLQIKRDAKT